MNLHMVCLKAY